MGTPAHNEELKKWFERFIGLPFRLRHKIKSRERHRVRRDTLKTITKTLRGAAKLGAHNTRVVCNVGLYGLLLDQDLAFFTDDLVGAIGDRKRIFFAKNEAVLLYEAAEDLPQLLGKEFRDAVNALGATPDQLQRLNRASSDLNQFWQKERLFLGTIRNVLTAHRDHDSLRYLDSLESLKPLGVMTRAAELSPLLGALIRALTEIARLTIGVDALVKDMVRSREKS